MRNLLWMALLLGVFGLAPAGAQFRDSRSPFATNDPLAKALETSDVYVGKTLRSQIQESALRSLTERAPADRKLKIVVVKALPESGNQYGTRDRYTRALYEYLDLGQGALLIVTQKGASLASDSVSSQETTEALRQHARTLQNDPVEGIRRVVETLGLTAQTSPANVAATAPQESGTGALPWIGVLGVGAGAGALVWYGRKVSAKNRAMTEARRPVERLRGETLEGITYADTYLDLLPDSDDATAAREARQEAARLLEQAAGFARSAQEPNDYGRAQALLEQAKEQAARARHHIDLATGGTGLAVAVEGTDYKATPLTASQAAPVVGDLHPEDIPESERGACFFCSRPARISDLTPITIALDGQRRKVLACADDVYIVQQGATPEVRTVEDNGQRVPWYRSSRYDPYRDYTRSEAVYAPGYNRYDSGVADGFLFGLMLSQPMPMPYPVFVGPSGYATNDVQMAETAPESQETEGVGSVDFFGTSGSDFESGDGQADSGDSVGGLDFGGGSDSSSNDSGGGDSGGSDSGGSDFGGGDSGGSDY